MSDQEEIRQRRSELRREFKNVYREVTQILFEEDPIGIDFETYEPEVSTILPRLRVCRTVDEVRAVVHHEFVRWFGADTPGRRIVTDRSRQRSGPQLERARALAESGAD